MKKLALIIGLIFVNLICYAHEKNLNSAYTELVEWNGEGKNNSKPFVLEIERESFENFLEERNKDIWVNRTFTKDSLLNAVKNNEDIFFYGFGPYYKNNVIQKDKYIFLNQFTIIGQRNFAVPIGVYVGRLISEDEVVTYRFSEKKINKEIFKDLKSYVYFDTAKNAYMWLREESQEEFTSALQNKDSSLPPYVLLFQKEWEKIIGQYIFGNN